MARGPLRVTRAGKLPVMTRPPALGTIDFALRHVPGGRSAIMRYAGLAAEFEPRLAPIVTAWHQLTPWQRRGTTIDALVVQVGGLTPGEFLGAVTRAMFEFTDGVADLCVAVALPDLVEQTVQSAMRLNSTIGQRDRMALLRRAGFLPAPKGVAVRLRNPGPRKPAVEPEIPAFMKALALTVDRKAER